MADSPQWLTPEQRQILETLRQTPATTLDLAERLGLESARVTRCVHGLQEAGLVRLDGPVGGFFAWAGYCVTR